MKTLQVQVKDPLPKKLQIKGQCQVLKLGKFCYVENPTEKKNTKNKKSWKIFNKNQQNKSTPRLNVLNKETKSKKSK